MPKPIAYSFDFKAADEIRVRLCTAADELEGCKERSIATDDEIARIVALLKQFPSQGDACIDRSSGEEMIVTAYTQGQAFAHVIFRDQKLQAEDTAYFKRPDGDHVIDTEAELYELLAGELGSQVETAERRSNLREGDGSETNEPNVTPYSMDFVGAKRLLVVRTDYDQMNQPQQAQEIADPDIISE